MEAMTTWERVLYTNALSLPPCVLLSAASGELGDISRKETWNGPAVAAVAAAALCGVAMSYSSFAVRAAVSATQFTVLGVMCKIFSVALNCVIWDKHASPFGLGALAVCLLAGSCYEQSPLRTTTSAGGGKAKAAAPQVGAASGEEDARCVALSVRPPCSPHERYGVHEREQP